MKVKIIKGSRAGQTVDVPHRRAIYWKLIGFAVEVFEVIKEAVKEKKERKKRKKKGD